LAKKRKRHRNQKLQKNQKKNQKNLLNKAAEPKNKYTSSFYFLLKMRLFIAIDVSKEAEQELRKAQKSLEQKGIRCPDKFHMTLKFLGGVSEDKVENIMSDLEKVHFPKFELSLDRLDTINPDYIRVIHANVTPLTELLKLGNLVDKATSKIKRDHDFKPHITIARVKFIEDKKIFLEKVRAIKLEKISFKVDEFHLLKSTLTKQGPIHEIVQTFKLE
jgi:2'-5' RNA ligase